MGRKPCCSKEAGLNRGAWTSMEDEILTEYIKLHGEGKWRDLPQRAGLRRCGKSCRLRWLNYLRPTIKRGNITPEEEDLIIRLHSLLGNRWALIAGRLPGRTDNEIKNYWHTKIAKTSKVQQKPNVTTNQPISESAQLYSTATIKPRVVGTKATRCAKAVIIPFPAQDGLAHNNEPAAAVAAGPTTSRSSMVDHDDEYEKTSAGTESLLSPLMMTSEKENEMSCSFIRDFDFELGEHLLSDFFNEDLVALPSDFENGVEINDASTKSEEKHLLTSEDELVDCSDLQNVAALVDSDLDWLQVLSKTL